MSYEYNPKSNVVFGDVDLSDYNAYAVYCNIFERPERDISVVSVPGRNGDLIFDNGRYKNVDRIYEIHVVGVENVHNLIRDLVSTVGYQRLEDEYEPNVYMMARLKAKPSVRKFVGNAVMLTVTFDRMPQKWDKYEKIITSGETYGFYRRGSGSTMYNPSAKLVMITNNMSYIFQPIIEIDATTLGSGSGSMVDFDIFQSKDPMSTPVPYGSGNNLCIDDFYDIINDTWYPKKELILKMRFRYGKTGWIDGNTISFVMDSEKGIVYEGSTNINSVITNYADFPRFTEGENYLYVIATNTSDYSFDVNTREWIL